MQIIAINNKIYKLSRSETCILSRKKFIRSITSIGTILTPFDGSR